MLSSRASRAAIWLVRKASSNKPAPVSPACPMSAALATAASPMVHAAWPSSISVTSAAVPSASGREPMMAAINTGSASKGV